jgi:tripeptide aminopeptidase
MEGSLEFAKVSFILRDFDDELLAEKATILRGVLDKIMKRYPNSTAQMIVKEQYRNMKKILLKYPQVTSYALEAIKRAGLKPNLGSIRGGTDGSRLSFMGLPCPNLFAGEQAIHSRHEWVSVQDMHKAVETIIHLCMIWEEKTVQ